MHAVISRLDSGYVHVRWTMEIWCQFLPSRGEPTTADFFHPGYTYSGDRAREAYRLALALDASHEGMHAERAR